MHTGNTRTNYQSDGGNFAIRMMAEGRGNGSETLIDKKNEMTIRVMGTGGGGSPIYNAGGCKNPSPEELKKPELFLISETKEIPGFPLKKYTNTYK